VGRLGAPGDGQAGQRQLGTCRLRGLREIRPMVGGEPSPEWNDWFTPRAVAGLGPASANPWLPRAFRHTLDSNICAASKTPRRRQDQAIPADTWSTKRYPCDG
jgi:hypothetical protein